MATVNHGYCTVCGKELDLPREFEGRRYCKEHFIRFWNGRSPVWRATFLTFALMALLSIGLGILGQLVGEVEGIPRAVFSIALAFLPAVVWLFLLYRTARGLELEVPTSIPTIFLLSILIAAALVRPVIFELIDIDNWLATTTASNRFFGNVLMRGFIHAFFLYAVIRYSVWRTPLFEQRSDGVLYTLTAGWGYASTLTLLSVLDQNTLIVLHAGLRMLALQCAYLAPGILMGYFLGRNRFENMPIYYLSLGLVTSAVVSGLLLYAGTELDNTRVNLITDGYSPYPGIVFSYLLLILVTSAVYGLINRHNALTRARMANRSDADV